MSDKHHSIGLALIKAQQAISAVGKDAVNQHHKYAYTSAEGMLSACRAALHTAGLAFARIGWTVELRDGQPFVLSTYIVTLGLGEPMTLGPVPWPIIEDKGRPFDKALAGALTTSQSYMLRDLLLVPREDEQEVDRRDDRAHDPELMGIRGAVALRKRLTDAGLAVADLRAAMSSKGVAAPEDMAQWPRALAPRIDGWINRQRDEQDS
jgi:hypothetical protein